MIISDKLYINVLEIENYVAEICRLFTYKNPDYHRKKRLKLSVKNINPSLYNYKLENINNIKYLVLPRGCLSRLKEYFNRNNIKIRILDKRLTLPSIDCHLINTVLEPQQELLIKTLVDNEGGLFEMPPASGKTKSSMGLMSVIKQPTLIVVHETNLQKQWIKELTTSLGGSYVIGQWGEGKKERGDIDVGLIQTLHLQVDADDTFLDNYGMIIVDECHRSACTTFLKVLNNSKAKYRIGITGTVERKDGLEILTKDIIGPVLMSIPEGQIKHRITNFEFNIINTEVPIKLPSRKRWTGSKREDMLDITEAINLLTKNEKRNILILDAVIKDIEDGYLPLILSDRKEHVLYLDKRLKELGYNSKTLIGGRTKKENWEETRSDSTIQVFVASTKKAEEGLDIPPLSSIHLTCPSSNYPKIKQRIGRIRRWVEGKKLPKITDYVDNLVYFEDSDGAKQHIFMYGAKNRIKFYRKLQRDYVLESSSL
jgi:superfamily II DNA or RNA helicase